MKYLLMIFLVLLSVVPVNAQKYMTRTGYISFFSHTPMEDIKADNNQVASVMDISTGEIVFQVLMKSFHFKKSLMEEHFNSNYVESDKFPRSTFKGKIVNISDVDINNNGVYDVTVEGDLTIHDVTKPVSIKGTLEILKGAINAKSVFNIQPEDYNITIPAVVRNNIAKTVEVSVDLKYTEADSK